MLISKPFNPYFMFHVRFYSIKTRPLIAVSSKLKQSHLQAWADPEGSRSLRLPDFKTIGT